MQSRSFLRLLAPFALAALMVSCGDDPAGGNSGDDEEQPSAKKDAGIKRRDGGASKPAKEEPEEEEEDADEEEEPVTKADAGVAKTSCTKDDDCISDEVNGTGCCDKPTKVCFFTEKEMCPAPVSTKPTQPPYN